VNLPVTTAVARTVSVPAAALWAVLRTGRDVDRILSDLVRTCRVDGAGPGAQRRCGTDQGDIEETLLAVDDEARLFRYRIDRQSVMPVVDYEGSVHVVDLGRGQSHVLWFASYRLAEPAAQAAVSGSLQQLFGAGIDGLATLAREAS
jgi:hypothetical protein